MIILNHIKAMTFNKFKKNKKGFTLIELLIVIAIIAILAAIIITALNPLKRFRDSRDARRWSDVIGILNAVIIDQVDNGGMYLDVIGGDSDGEGALNVGEIYMIGTATSGCDDNNNHCVDDVDSDSHCVDLTGLTNEGYLGRIAYAPKGVVSWTSEISGYTLERKTDYNIVIRSCESEGLLDIYVMH